MALQPNGKAVVAGTCQSSTSLSFCAVRYNRDGTLDTTFGTNGKTITTVVSDSDSAQALTLQNDGKIVLAGSCRNGASFDFCAVRYNSDGSIDTSFATNGKLLLTIGSGGVRLTTIAVQRDEKLILIGDCNTSSNGDFCAARFHPNGILDTSFGVNGIVITQVGAGFDYSKASTVQPDGKILVADVPTR